MRAKKQSDYGDLHKGIVNTLHYEQNVYAKDSYDSRIWEIEREILIKIISSIKKME